MARIRLAFRGRDETELRIVALANNARRRIPELAVASPLDHRILPATYAPELVVIVQPVPMLAQLQERLPRGAEWPTNRNWMVFGGLLGHDRGCAARLLSRNGRDLRPWFPELVEVALKLPHDTRRHVVDGEIVIADQRGAIDFGALQTRLTIARKDIRLTAAEHPAVLCRL